MSVTTVTSKDHQSLLDESFIALDFLGQVFLREPNMEVLMQLQWFLIKAKEIHPRIIDDRAMKMLENVVRDSSTLNDLQFLFSHFFKDPTSCQVPLYESVKYFGYIKPDFLDDILAKVKIEYKPVKGIFADHFAMKCVLAAIIVTKAIRAQIEDEYFEYLKIAKEFLERHVMEHLEVVSTRIQECQCRPRVNIYAPLIQVLQVLMKDLLDHVRAEIRVKSAPPS